MSVFRRKSFAFFLLQLISFAALGDALPLQTVAVEGGHTESKVDQPPASNTASSVSEWAVTEEPYVSGRIKAIRDAIDNPFSIASHKSNYVLPAAYRELMADTAMSAGDRYGLPAVDALEAQFQLSLQLPVWSGFLGEDSFLSFAYTNRSFWQAYGGSGPFREINHEVEAIATWESNRNFLGFHNVATQMGVSHQSNGRGGPYSRGWNRVYANFMFEREHYSLSFKPWYRIASERSAGRGPDLDFYLGNFELTGGYRVGDYSSKIMLRNNLRSENRGALELSWGFPITKRVRGFVKYFDGYGESLIDYSSRVRTLGLGLELAPGI